VFRLAMHVQRLSESGRAMAEAEAKAAAGEAGAGAAAAAASAAAAAEALIPPPAALRAAAELVMARAARSILRQKKDDEEVKLTLLLNWPAPPAGTTAAAAAAAPAAGGSAPAPPAAGRLRLLCHAQALPAAPRPAAVVRAVACGTPRANARAKDSAWVRERRAAVELAKRAAAALDASTAANAGDANANAAAAAAPAPSIPVEETLLVGPDGALEEGASSNFFVLTRDGALQTAGEDSVLPGTVRAVALDVARRGVAEGWPGWPVSRVEEGAAPRLGDASAWRACFVSSTSRQLLRVDEVLDATGAAAAEAAGLPVPAPAVAFSVRGAAARPDEGVASLVAAVRDAILADSEPLPLDGAEE